MQGAVAIRLPTCYLGVNFLWAPQMEAEGSHHGSASSDVDLEAVKRRLHYLAAPASPLEINVWPPSFLPELWGWQ